MKHQATIQPTTAVGLVRKILRETLKGNASPALRAHAQSIAAHHGGDTEHWFQHWCQMLDVIQEFAEYPAITITDVTQAMQGNDGPRLQGLTDDQLDRLIDETRRRDPCDYCSSWDLNELLASWDGSDAQKKLDEMASTDVDLSPLWSS